MLAVVTRRWPGFDSTNGCPSVVHSTPHRYARANFSKPRSAKRDPTLAAQRLAAGDGDGGGGGDADDDNGDAQVPATTTAALGAQKTTTKKQKKPAVSLNAFYGDDSDSDDSGSSNDAEPAAAAAAEGSLLDLAMAPPASSAQPAGSAGASAATSSVSSPTAATSGGGGGGGGGGDGGHMDPDLKLLLQSAVKLMPSRNSGVLLAVTKVYVYLGTANPRVLDDLSEALLSEVCSCVRLPVGRWSVGPSVSALTPPIFSLAAVVFAVAVAAAVAVACQLSVKFGRHDVCVSFCDCV